MEKQRDILTSYHSSIHKILCLFEQMELDKIGRSEYLAYLDNVYVKFLGINQNIAVTIKGLSKLDKNELTHTTVRRVVMGLHDVLDKEGAE